MMSARLTRVHYAWFVAAATFVVLIVAAGIRATPSVLIVPLQNAMGWSRTTISLAIAINIALYGLMGPFSAALMARIGLRATIAIALAVLAFAVGATSFVTQPWEFIVLWGVLVGSASGMVALVLAAAVATRWFSARRGLVVGILTASTATGQLLFLPLLAVIVTQSGWRPVTWFVSAAAAAALIPALLVIRDRPESIGLRPFGASADATAADVPLLRSGKNPIAVAFSALGRASHSRDFWLLAGSFFICGASTNGLIGTHFIPACGDHGIPEVRAAGMLAAMGVLDLVGTTASGWFTDRWSSRGLLAIYYGFRGLSLLFLPLAFSLSGPGLTFFAIFYGLDWIATVPPTVKLATEIFGKDDAPIVYGWISASHQLGAGTVALVAGVIRQQTSSYTPAFEISGVLCLMATILVLRIRASARPFSQPLVVANSSVGSS